MGQLSNSAGFLSDDLVVKRKSNRGGTDGNLHQAIRQFAVLADSEEVRWGSGQLRRGPAGGDPALKSGRVCRGLRLWGPRRRRTAHLAADCRRRRAYSAETGRGRELQEIRDRLTTSPKAHG